MPPQRHKDNLPKKTPLTVLKMAYTMKKAFIIILSARLRGF